jgi:hypothetical protein
MKLDDLVRQLELTPLTPRGDAYNRDIRAGYASDLLSDVLAHAPAGGILVTVQVHLNVIAVAVHAELPAIIFASNRAPDPTSRRKAADEGLALFGTSRSAFDLVGQLYGLGIRGSPT